MLFEFANKALKNCYAHENGENEDGEKRIFSGAPLTTLRVPNLADQPPRRCRGGNPHVEGDGDVEQVPRSPPRPTSPRP